MKKILVLYTIFMASILFYFSYDSYNFINYAKIMNMQNNLGNEITSFQIDILDKNYHQDILKTIATYANQNKIQYIVGDLIPSEDGSMLYYEYINIYDNDLFYDNVRMVSGKKIDFTDLNNLGYISSNTNDKQATGTISSYNNTYFMHEFQVFQFKNANIYLPEAYNTRLNFFVEGNTKAKNLTSMLQEKYNDDIITINFRQAHGGSIEEIESTYRQSDIEYAIVCSFIVMLLIMLCIIIKDKKEILIRKMHGQNSLRIVLELYLKKALMIWLIYVITFLILWLLVIRQWDNFYIELFNDIIKYISIGLLLIPLILLLAHLYIKMTTNVIELKNQQKSKAMIYINVILKIAISIIIMMPLVTSLNQAYFNLEKYIYTKQHYQEYTDYYTFAYFEGNKEELEEVFQQNIYFDMSDYNYASDINAYAYTGMPNIENTENLPIIYVNKKYLENYHFVDNDNHDIDINKINDQTILVPKKYQNKQIHESGTIIKVKNTHKHYNLNLRQSAYYVDEPIIVIYAHSDWISANSQGLFLKNKNRNELENEISKITDQDYRISSVKSDINNYSVRAQNIFINTFSKIVMCLALYALFIFQFASLYIQDNKKELSIMYLSGKTKFNRYSNIFISNLCIYLLIILIAVLYKKIMFILCMEFAIIFFVFDMIFLLLFIRHFERKSIVANLKGE
ncbi:DUF1430 domain-containing protein [Thomasclavelia spiroformis]|uniref:DUF1430 domain-containing protein n=1 Tax=Thomasclavelia spiroformis TaxID=29348 RepID=UPI002431DF4A|nr:DUF1430 domain-containing protein [Thomasclavelia spiroformis]